MITAVDTNILLDVLVDGAPDAATSSRSLRQAMGTGRVVICEAVFAELAPRFPTADEAERFLADTSLNVIRTSLAGLHRAGQAWRTYLARSRRSIQCPVCGAHQTPHCSGCGGRLGGRQHIIADFLIGAHAEVHAERLLTRDLGFYKTYFPNLKLG